MCGLPRGMCCMRTLSNLSNEMSFFNMKCTKYTGANVCASLQIAARAPCDAFDPWVRLKRCRFGPKDYVAENRRRLKKDQSVSGKTNCKPESDPGSRGAQPGPRPKPGVRLAQARFLKIWKYGTWKSGNSGYKKKSKKISK